MVAEDSDYNEKRASDRTEGSLYNTYWGRRESPTLEVGGNPGEK